MNVEIINKNLLIVGFDYGICQENGTNYSSIFNEILFGKVSELTSFYELLNDNLLFDSEGLVNEYVSMHHKCSQEGKDVEWEEYMEVFKIYKYSF